VENGTPGTSFTVETTTSLNESTSWTPLWTTNPPALPFEFTDFDLSGAQKFYRVRQP